MKRFSLSLLMKGFNHCYININKNVYVCIYVRKYVCVYVNKLMNDWMNEREREMFYLTTHSTHFIYCYMASDLWLRTILIVRKEICCRHIGYSYRLTARVLLYAPSHRQDNTYHSLCYTGRGALAGMRNRGPPHEGSSDDPSHHEWMLYLWAMSRSPEWMNEWMNDWMNDWMNEWSNKWMNEWINKWMIEWMNEWLNKYMTK